MVNGDLPNAAINLSADVSRSQRDRSPQTRVRWTVCALIFFAMTVNYMDRQIFSQLVPLFENDLRLGPTDLALINVSFILPYGFSMLFVGRFIDRVGVRKGLGSTYLLWNIASAAHAAVRGLGGFMSVRFLLGIGESGMYPSAVKTMTEWFPAKDRSLANGYVNAGANCGAIAAPLFANQIATRFGWRMCFVITGTIGLVWLFFWNRIYRPIERNPKVSESELAYIRQDADPASEPITYRQLFAMRPIYALSIAKALSDAPFWFYLTWMPKFFTDQFHVNGGVMALATAVIYIVADVGSVSGGWLSSNLIARGKSVNSATKIAMLVCALAVVPVMSVGGLIDHPPILGISCFIWAVALTSIAAGAHQGWSANLFTLISDTTPKNATAMAVGAINGFAMIGVSAMQFFVGWSVQVTSSYTLPFIAAGSLYLIALGILQIMMPKVEKSSTNRLANMPLVVAGGVAVLAALGILQYETNRPPYQSVGDYLFQRGSQLHMVTAPIVGPSAKVGWMDARWYRWGAKTELIKIDSHGHPFVESKGAKADRYQGPSLQQVGKAFR